MFSPNSLGPLYQISASGGTPAPLTTLSAGEFNHRWPKFLPDTRTFLYFVHGTEPGVYVTTLDRPGDTKLLLKSASDATYVPGQGDSPGHLLSVARDTVMAQPFDAQSAQLTGSVVAVPGTGGVASYVAIQRTSVSVSNDGTLLYSSGGARYQLGWFGRDGRPIGTVGAIEQYIGLRLLPDDREVLVTIRDAAANGDLWRIDLASESASRRPYCSRRSTSATRNSHPMAGGWRLRQMKTAATTCTCRASLTDPLDRSHRVRGARIRGGAGGSCFIEPLTVA